MSESLFYVLPASVEAVKTAVENALVTHVKKDYVSTEWKGNRLMVTIKKLGTSTIEFQVEKVSDVESKIVEVSKKIALAHRAFEGTVRELIGQVIEKARKDL